LNKNKEEGEEEMKQRKRRWSRCRRRRNRDINKYIRQITGVSMGWYNQYLQVVLKYAPFHFPPTYLSFRVLRS
jgi:hypothetical protein